MIKKKVSLYKPLLSSRDANFLAKVFSLFGGDFCVLGASDVSVFDILGTVINASGRVFYSGAKDFAERYLEEHPGIAQERQPLENDFVIAFAMGNVQKKKTIQKLSDEGRKRWLVIAKNIDPDGENVVYNRFAKPGISKLAVIASDEVYECAQEHGILGIVKNPSVEPEPAKWPTFLPGDDIRHDSDVRVVPTSESHALYYRDLFAHKLGTTRAESYYLILLDGKVFGTFGVAMSRVYRMVEDYYSEVYGFTAYVEKFPRSGRLLMMIITSNEMKRVLMSQTKANRVYKLSGMKTVCLSKYRNSKSNNGIVRTERREKLPNGMYKIHYIAEFRKDTFKDCLDRFLTEEKEFINGEN